MVFRGVIFKSPAAQRYPLAVVYSGGNLDGERAHLDDAMGTFINSVARFKEATRDAGVDTWLKNHPLMVPFQDWVGRLGARSRTDPNPFVVGAASYQIFLDVLDGCSRVALERRRQ